VVQLAYSAHPEGCILVTDGEYSRVKSDDLVSWVIQLRRRWTLICVTVFTNGAMDGDLSKKETSFI
jgi:hypothetical protein